MNHRRPFCIALAPFAAGLVLAGCSDLPSVLRGDYDDTSITQAQANPASGSNIRWGGDIISLSPEDGRTCVEILGRPLNFDARPNPQGQPLGRFVACNAGFFDPEIYAAGREVTVAGTLSGVAEREIGKFNYRFPRIDASAIYLWPVEDLDRTGGLTDAGYDNSDPFNNSYNGNGLFYGSQLGPNHGLHEFKDLKTLGGNNDRKSDDDTSEDEKSGG